MNLNSILILIAALLGLALALWLAIRALKWWQSWQRARQRERVEDALKFLLDEQASGRSVTYAELAQSLRLSQRQASHLSETIQAQGLVLVKDQALQLTPEGERWALQIVRAHRLWERYLADEARLPLGQIHTLAHRREHGMTPSEIDILDATLGHPLNDPHGDPIPDASGKFRPGANGSVLTGWQVGQRGQVVHLEDEPPLAFAQILAVGIKLGQVLHVLESSPERIALSDGEHEYTLAPEVANSIFLEPVAEKVIAPNVIPLSKLPSHLQAEIVELDNNCQGYTRRRFLDLGLTPGSNIYPELDNFFGDPRGYRIRGTMIALRKDQAAQIWVRPLPPTSQAVSAPTNR